MDCIFGYGSLIWKPPPHAVKRTPCYLKGFTRRFAQSSSDHRGTPDAPGRVVTLVPSEEWKRIAPHDPFESVNQVWGCLYDIDPAYAEEVKEYMDVREQDGYSLEQVDVFSIDPETGHEVLLRHQAKLYVGHIDNPSFVGWQPVQELAAHIHKSVGPSGPNKQYLHELAVAIEALNRFSHDSYLAKLDSLVQQMDA